MDCKNYSAKCVLCSGKRKVSGKFITYNKPGKNYDDKIVFCEFFNVSQIPSCIGAKLIIVQKSGLLGHPLIVSREFKIPVIVGTDSFSDIPDDANITIDLVDKTYCVE